MNNKRITPEPGKFYILKTPNATIKLLCLSSQNGDAFFQNIGTGWTFTAHGVYQYDDGEIGWDYSTNEHFENVATIEFF